MSHTSDTGEMGFVQISGDTSDLDDSDTPARPSDTHNEQRPRTSTPTSGPSSQSTLLQNTKTSGSHPEPRLAAPDTRNIPHHASQTREEVQPYSQSSYSQPSEKQLAPLGSSSTDRVFPVRSVISVDPIPATPLHGPHKGNNDANDGFPGMVPASSELNTPGPVRRHEFVSSDEIPQAIPMPTKSSRAEIVPSQTGLPPSLQDGKHDTAADGVNDNRIRGRRVPTSTANGNSHGYGGGSRMQVFSDATSDGSGLPASPTYASAPVDSRAAIEEAEGPRGFLTARFKHIVTDAGHAIITGRDGETLQRCEDEPIHIPGAIQSFGVLLALQEVADGSLVVRVVSENSQRIMGYTPQELFALESFTDILSEEQADNLLDHVDFIRDEELDVGNHGPEVFTLSLRSEKLRSAKLWTAIHINPQASPGSALQASARVAWMLS